MSLTAADVRDKLVSTIEGIAPSLGYDSPYGNVKAGLLDFEHPELQAQYLMAAVTGRKKVSAWGVQVLDIEEPYGSNNLWRRRFQITVKGYAEIGIASVNELIVNARLVRTAIRGLGSCLGIGLKAIEQVSAVELAVETADASSDGGGSISTISWTYEAIDDVRRDEE
jgi:hypothetical protein